MQTIENAVLVPSVADAENNTTAEVGSYATVRFNALKHGILSRHVVLAHEDREEYDNLFAALVMEHQPIGATELHLVEELAGVLWRKRRVLMAEGARINEGLKIAANNPKSIMPAAAPFERGLSGEHADLRDLLEATLEEIAEASGTQSLILPRPIKRRQSSEKAGRTPMRRPVAHYRRMPDAGGTNRSRKRSTRQPTKGSLNS